MIWTRSDVERDATFSDVGLQITREIQANPEEIAELERSRDQAEQGRIRWIDGP